MDELVPDVIDLNVDPSSIDESWLRSFGFLTTKLLQHMFAGHPAPFKVRGTSSQVAAFATALGNEKRYMDSFLKYGLNDEHTLRSRSRLMGAVSKFEKETGLRWPYSS